MDETQQGTSLTSSDAWTLAALGMGIGMMVDRVKNDPQTIQSNTGYGVNPDGSVYQLGQPATTQNQTTYGANGNGTSMLLLIALVLLVSNHG